MTPFSGLDATGRARGQPLPHQEIWVKAVAFSPDGKTVITGSQDKTARLWDAATGQPLGQTLTHQGSVRAVAFSPDGKTVITGSWDKTRTFWDAVTARPRPESRRIAAVNAVVFSPDGAPTTEVGTRLARSGTRRRAGPSVHP